MHPSEWFAMRGHPPVCCGAGLVALDIILDDNEDSKVTPQSATGGSCGNVLTMLAYLGWSSYPIARLADDPASSEIIFDLQRWNVNVKMVERSKDGSTPIIVQRITVNRSGLPHHHFEWNCPLCGADLPRYKPVLVREIERISIATPTPQVFFFDRAVPSSVELARHYKEKGALIVFEPSAIRDEKLFNASLHLADVLKYSNDRMGNFHEMMQGYAVPLEIETLGSEGLRYRRCHQPWKPLPVVPIEKLIDSAGAGDWCTAGLIHLLGRQGQKGFSKKTDSEFETALKFGQTCAAINCQYAGARGCMYNLPKSSFEAQVKQRLAGNNAMLPAKYNALQGPMEGLQRVCPACVEKNIAQ